MSDADRTPSREPRSVAASQLLTCHMSEMLHDRDVGTVQMLHDMDMGTVTGE